VKEEKKKSEDVDGGFKFFFCGFPTFLVSAIL